MRMCLEQPISAFSESARVSLAVPRAKTTHEAEEAVAELLETIRRWDAASPPTPVPLPQERARRAPQAHRSRSRVGMDLPRERTQFKVGANRGADRARVHSFEASINRLTEFDHH